MPVPQLVDERDLHWEATETIFRILIFEATRTWAYDFSGSFHDAAVWAQEEAGGRSYRVGLVVTDRIGKGVYWLVIVGVNPHEVG